MLQGWKEIADYVSRDERTVKRWEKQRQLPVRRMPGAGRTNVYVLVAELDDWLSRTPVPTVSAPVEAPSPTPAARPRTWPLPTAIGVLVLATATALLAVRAHRTHAHANATAAPYVSKVPGVDDLYLRGVYFYEQHTPGSLAQARQYLQQAVAKDPADAPAWATLASTNLMLEQFDALPPAQGFDEAGTDARRALALDPSLADAHATLAFVDFFWRYDRLAAEQEFRTAITLDPNSASAHHRFGLMLLDLCRFPQALTELDLALRLQPDSTSIVASRALAFGFNGHRDDAIATLQSLAAQQPQNPIVWHNLALLAGLPPHNVPLFLESSDRLQQISHKPAPWPASAYRAYRSAGEPAMWRAIVASDPKNIAGSLIQAEALAQLGQSSAALDMLERGAQHPGDGMSGLASDPLLQPLHHEPRFQALLARIGVPPVQ
jgi:Tfp pilus assembly protein PilF